MLAHQDALIVQEVITIPKYSLFPLHFEYSCLCFTKKPKNKISKRAAEKNR